MKPRQRKSAVRSLRSRVKSPRARSSAVRRKGRRRRSESTNVGQNSLRGTSGDYRKWFESAYERAFQKGYSLGMKQVGRYLQTA